MSVLEKELDDAYKKAENFGKIDIMMYESIISFNVFSSEQARDAGDHHTSHRHESQPGRAAAGPGPARPPGEILYPV